jgi:hypothetical protein
MIINDNIESSSEQTPSGALQQGSLSSFLIQDYKGKISCVVQDSAAFLGLATGL